MANEKDCVPVKVIKFTNARKTFTDIYDNDWHQYLSFIINRHQN